MFVVTDPDPRRFLHTDELVWFDEPTGLSIEEQLEALPDGHRFALETDEADADPSAYAAVWGVYDLLMTVPGPLGTLRQIDTPGLTWVGVHPDQRRRGAATALLRDHFERARRAGHPVVALHASEPTIYGRHGYGIASQETRIELSSGAKLAAPGLDDLAEVITTRLVSLDEAGVPERVHRIARACAPGRLGAVVRPEATYRRFSRPTPASTRDAEPDRALIAVRDGQDVGVAWFGRTQKWEDGMPDGTLTVYELWGDAPVELALARRLVEFDLIARTAFRNRGVDDRLMHWSGTARGVVKSTADSLWLRLVDVPAALSARGYAGAFDVALRVERDEACPANVGTWRVRAGADGVAEVAATSAEPDLTIDPQTLAAAYLGDGRLQARLEAGLIEQHRPGSVARLEGAMRTSTAPVGAVGF